LMDRQENLVRSLRQRDENRKQALQYRQEKLKQLCELETLCDDDDRSIDSAFRKQTKEMEALAAVIAAARE
jgi:c-di-GMP-related signal transduction protein